ncbi:MAG: peroxidase family protein [Saprospiraceae bacterium]
MYGSDQERADWLRTFEGGKLKVSAGNLLPYNTVTGEFDAPIDPSAPHMDNATGISQVVFVAGDSRASENPLLASMHTLFVREHNRQCDILARKYPSWTDEQLYQHARKIVGGFVQSIVYDEWLPALGVNLPPYTGYNSEVNPQVMNVFTAAAFRMGHTLLNGNLMRLDNDGNVIPQGHLALRDAFFNPYNIQETGGIEPFLKGMAVQMQQKFDNKVIDDVRNFLFGQPGFGGLDLAAININRGRERGLPDFNTVRANFGFTPYNFFQQINPDANVFTRLLSTYQDINNIDPWVGLLSERPIPGTIFGQTIHEILVRQFTALRDGDRFYYWNDPVLTPDEKQYIHDIKFRDIVMYNTTINLMQDNIFGALEHDLICDNMTLNLAGQIRTEEGEPVSNVALELTTVSDLIEHLTQENGLYSFQSMPFCELNLLLPFRNDNPLNGVSTFDIIQIQKHILGIQPLVSPYQHIAADVNASGTITTLDLVRLRKVILGIESSFAGNTSWRFVLAAFDFPEGEDPLVVDFPEWLDFQSVHATNYNSGFIAVKVGDVNNSVNTGNMQQQGTARDLAEGMAIQYAPQYLKAGEQAVISLQLLPNMDTEGWQFELELNDARLLNVDTDWDAQTWHVVGNSLRMSVFQGDAIPADRTIRLLVQATADQDIEQILSLGNTLSPRTYIYGVENSVVLRKTNITDEVTLAQNEPNPFNQYTVIPFLTTKEESVHLWVQDAAGHTIYKGSMQAHEGMNQWLLTEDMLQSAKGVFIYHLVTSAGTVSRKMVKQ